MDFRNALKKTGLWFLGNIFFGLVTIILIYILNLFKFSARASDILSRELKHLLRDGIIVFFACALMGSVVVDILIDEEERKEATWWFKGLPFILLGTLVVVYLLILFGKLGEDFFETATTYPILIDVLAFIYCFYIKLENFTRR